MDLNIVDKGAVKAAHVVKQPLVILLHQAGMVARDTHLGRAKRAKIDVSNGVASTMHAPMAARHVTAPDKYPEAISNCPRDWCRDSNRVRLLLKPRSSSHR